MQTSTTYSSLPKSLLPRTVLAAEYWFRPEQFLNRCDQLGDRFQISFPGLPPTVGISSPQDIRAIFTGDQSALYLGAGVKKLAPHELLLGETSLIVKDGDEHLCERRMLNPHFMGARLRSYEPMIAQVTREAVHRWPRNQTVSFHSLMMELTLDIIIHVVFGVHDRKRADDVRSATQRLVDVIGSARFAVTTIVAMARGGKWDGKHKLVRNLKARLDKHVVDELVERRATGNLEQDDILSIFLKLQQEHGVEVMSDASICDAMRTLLIAGYETTATSLAWIAERLVRHPDVLESLEKAIENEDSDYVDAIITEGMRVRSVLPFTVRMVVKPFDLNGLQLDVGTLVLPMISLLHRRADLYPNPHEFRPERFIGRPVKNFQWIPFGGGLRKCLGGPFAMLEMRVIVETIYRELRLLPTNEPDEQVGRRNVTLVPSRGAQVVMEQRS